MNECVLICDHSSMLALTKGKEMKSMRQQRYAMDLSEHSITIVHRAGASLHLADALSRVGYTKKYSDSIVGTPCDASRASVGGRLCRQGIGYYN